MSHTYQEFTDPALPMAVRIPSPPPLLDELHALLEDPRSEMEDIARVVQSDAGLTSRLYRTLSKPCYGLRKPPETVNQAVSLVGLNTVAELTKGLSLEAAIYGESRFYPWFWERANEIASYARVIAWKQRSVCNIFPEHAQLAALFMDCGVPILIQHIEKYEYPFTTADGYIWPNVLAEDANFDTDHAVVGFLAARHWKMPDYVCQAVRWHHDPVNVNARATTLAAILHLATHVYNLYAGKDDSDWPEQEMATLEELGIARDEQQEYVEDVHERAAEA
ncbi:MAG: HDOD domain-containing protein [Thiobacillus sp.]|nr:HDOD domain-containing protein [Thiobacillus sp.]